MISVRTPSSGVIRKFTPKPEATPANAAAIPASGLRPTLLNAAAPRGISTRYPASDATLERMPMKTMIGVSNASDETATSFRISAPISPDASARPTPIITTRMIATAAKLRKLATNEVKMNRMPSADRRLWTAAVWVTILYSPSCTEAFGRPPDGCVDPPWTFSSTAIGGGFATSYVTLTSNQARTTERTITPTQSQMNRIAGCGILLPPRSIAPRMRTIIPVDSVAGAAVAGGSLMRLHPVGLVSPSRRSGGRIRPRRGRLSRTRLRGRARSAHGCWQSRPSCRARGSRRPARPSRAR